MYVHRDPRPSVTAADTRDERIRSYAHVVIAFGGLYQAFRFVRAGLFGFDGADWIFLGLYLGVVGLALGRTRPRVIALYILAGFAIAQVVTLLETGFSGAPSLVACTLPVLTALFLGGRFPYIAMAGSMGAFGIVGTLRIVGAVLPAVNARLLDPKLFVNWVGMAVALAAVIAPAVWLVSRVTSDLDVSTKGLARARSLHEMQVHLSMEAEAALEKAVERREQARQIEAAGLVISGVVHDLNNALAVLLAWSESLRSEPTADVGVRAAAAKIERSCTQTARITKELLAVARPSHPTSGGCPLWSQLSAAIAVAERALPEDIRIVAEQAIDENLWVAFDASALTSVVLALVAAARLHPAAGSEIRIVARKPSVDECASLPACVAVVQFLFEGDSAVPTDPALTDEVTEQGGQLFVDTTDDSRRAVRLLLSAMPGRTHWEVAAGG